MSEFGRILFATTRIAGASTIGTEVVGQNVISLDNIRDFPLDAGFVYLDGAVVPFTAVDRENDTITLGTALTAELPNGTTILQYPYAVQRWALVAPPGNGSGPVDAVWCVVPHALAGFLAADGQRAEDAQEKVRFIELENHNFMIEDVIDKEVWLDPFTIPDGSIKVEKLDVDVQGDIDAAVAATADIADIQTELVDINGQLTDITTVQLPGKNKVTYSTATPGITANNAGDTWFTWESVGGRILSVWQGNGGTSWTQRTLDGATLANLDAGSITVGTLAAARLGAGTIDVTKLNVGDFTNLIADADLLDPTHSNWNGTTRTAPSGANPGFISWNAGNGFNQHVYNKLKFLTKANEEFWIEGEASTPGFNTVDVHLYPSLQVEDASGTVVTWPQRPPIILPPGTGWTPFSGKITIPDMANIARGQWDPFATTTANGQGVSVRKMVLKRRGGGNLLVDGTVTTVHLAAEAVTAAKLAAESVTTNALAAQSVTAEILASNSVSTEHLQANSVTATAIDTDALNGKTITGALIRSAASGRRVELTSDGILQYGVDGAVIFKLGDTNMFSGDVDATSITIQDSLQLFGQGNLIANGAVVTLKSKFGDPNTPPTLSYDYPVGPNAYLTSGWWTAAVHSNNGVVHSVVEHYWNLARLRFADGRYWDFPQIQRPGGAPGETVAEFKPWSMVRIVNQGSGISRVVLIGDDYTHVNLNDNTPQTWIRVYDDSPMQTNGSVAPTLLYDDFFANFSWNRQYRLIRVLKGTSDRHRFGVLSLEKTGGNGNSSLYLYIYEWWNADNLFTESSYTPFGAVISADNNLTGGAYGDRDQLKMDTTNGGASTDTMLVAGFDADHNGTPGNYVYNFSTGWESNSYWPVATDGSGRMWADGDPAAGTMTNYYACPWQASAVSRKYANNHKRITTNIWASYVWRGELNSGLLTIESPRASLAYRRRATIKVTVPNLPPPLNGFGAARLPASDVYGWRYYIAASSANPATIHEGANNPTMTANTALAVTSAVQEVYPTNAGNQPPATGNFPNTSAAEIQSEDGSLVIDGIGDIMARNIFADYLNSGGDLDVTGDITVNDVFVGGQLWIGSRLLDDTGWLTPTFSNSWVSYGGVYPARYRRLNGVVYLEGLIRFGTVGAVTALNLPTGFRPSNYHIYNQRSDGNPGSAYVEVTSGGDVFVVQATNNNWVSLDGISFPV